MAKAKANSASSGDGNSANSKAKMKSGTSQARDALNRFKMEAANEVGVNLNSESLSAKDAGSVGGQMVKKMIASYESNLSGN
jgi:hypothetical protein